MSLTSRKKRPLSRDKQEYRDDRLYIIASDDRYAPQQYFDSFEIPRIKILVEPTLDGTSSANHVLGRLDAYEVADWDEKWMLLDTDHYVQGSHAANFTQAITEARQKGIRVALSNPCFDFWLWLHHIDINEDFTKITDAKSVLVALRATLGSFNKTNIDTSQYSFSSVANACRVARHLDQLAGGGDRPDAPTSRVYQLWESIISNSTSQAPADLLQIIE